MPSVDVPGCRIHYIVEGSGPPVLLLQGAGVIAEGWRPQLDGLRDRFRLVAVDNRGIGGSTMMSGPVSIDAMACDALAVAGALSLDSFHLAGHSVGGLIAQQIALAAPRRVRSLALLCTFARGRQALRPTPSLLLAMLRTRAGTRAMRRRAFLGLVMPPASLRTQDCRALAERLATLFGHDLADQPPIVMQQLRAAARYDAASRLCGLDGIPALVVSASGDRVAPPGFGRELAGCLPNARYVEIEDAAHGVTIQRPELVNRILARHFAEAEAAVSGGGPIYATCSAEPCAG